MSKSKFFVRPVGVGYDVVLLLLDGLGWMTRGLVHARHLFTIPVGGGVKGHLFLGRLHLLESLKLY